MASTYEIPSLIFNVLPQSEHPLSIRLVKHLNALVHIFLAETGTPYCTSISQWIVTMGGTP